MNRVIEHVIEAGYADRILSERQLSRILGGSDDSRYALVKRAMQAGALVKIRRGQYVLADKYRKHPVQPYQLAQAIVVGSYISMESALAFHGWIPEAVFTVVSVIPMRKSNELDHPKFGRFSFCPLAVNKLAFLVGVERRTIGNQNVLVAKPLRALLDLVAYKKMTWQGMDWIVNGMRIDVEHLLATPNKDFQDLRTVYKHRSVLVFLAQLERAVTNLKTQRRVRTEEVTGDD